MRELRLVEATSLVAGAGIGGGVMAVPFLVTSVGLVPALLIMLVAYGVTVTLHIMIAELSLKTDYSSELLTVFTRHLFRNGKVLRGAFYVLMAVTLICNLAAYIAGSGNILTNLAGFPQAVSEALFFVFAAAVVFFGLKRVAINETLVLLVMLAFLTVLAVHTLLLPAQQQQVMPATSWAPSPLLAVYGMVMFSLSSLFAVPQVASGLRGGRRRLLVAIGGGLLINLLVIAVVTFCTLLSSPAVTQVAIIGWTDALGGPTRIFGSLFIVLAMLTTFWSISLQLADMTRRFFNAGRFPAWLIATVPAFLLALLPLTSFLDLMQIAGGATAVIIAFMAVPAYLNATRTTQGAKPLLLGRLGQSRILCAIIVIMYLTMAVASFM